MIITCSVDMQKALKIKVEPVPDKDRLFTWYAHTFKWNRRNCVILMNSASRFSIVLYGLCAADFSKFQDNVITYIRQALENYHLSTKIIDAYFEDCKEVTFAKNTNREDTSRLNRVCTILKKYHELQENTEEDTLLQRFLSKYINKRISYEENNTIWYSHKRFFELLKEKYQMYLYDFKMYQLKITLDFPDNEISREVLVPDFYTFWDLHMIIQNCFNWENYHMYEFAVMKGKKIQILIYSGMQEEFLEEFSFCEIPSLRDDECTVSNIIRKGETIIYTYDMGDNWQHKIKLVKIISEHNDMTPVCLKVTGKAPPEDCGGIYGYMNFLKEIQQGDEEMLEWANSVKWEEQTVDKINRKFKYNFS